MIDTIIAALASGGICGSVGLLWRAKSQNRKDDADAAAVLTDAAGRFVVTLERRVHELSTELSAANEELAQLRIETRGLMAEVNECRRQHPPLRRVQ